MTDIVERLRSGAAHQSLVTTGLVNQAADEITRLRADVKLIVEERDRTFARMLSRAEKAEAENERLRAALCADDQTLRLHLGEMTAQEMRTLKAGFKWALARAALQQEVK